MGCKYTDEGPERSWVAIFFFPFHPFPLLFFFPSEPAYAYCNARMYAVTQCVDFRQHLHGKGIRQRSWLRRLTGFTIINIYRFLNKLVKFMRSYYRISSLSWDTRILRLRSAGYELTPGKLTTHFTLNGVKCVVVLCAVGACLCVTILLRRKNSSCKKAKLFLSTPWRYIREVEV